MLSRLLYLDNSGRCTLAAPFVILQVNIRDPQFGRPSTREYAAVMPQNKLKKVNTINMCVGNLWLFLTCIWVVSEIVNFMPLLNTHYEVAYRNVSFLLLGLYSIFGIKFKMRSRLERVLTEIRRDLFESKSLQYFVNILKKLALFNEVPDLLQ